MAVSLSSVSYFSSDTSPIRAMKSVTTVHLCSSGVVCEVALAFDDGMFAVDEAHDGSLRLNVPVGR
ncbi:hypothetical protein FQN55_002914 [Onygenales sp. PD_40]|nr:hypothetical protein FQN55_002914 [Onygenales sp. PD_40]